MIQSGAAAGRLELILQRLADFRSGPIAQTQFQRRYYYPSRLSSRGHVGILTFIMISDRAAFLDQSSMNSS